MGSASVFWFESTCVPYWERTYNKKLNAIVPIGRDSCGATVDSQAAHFKRSTGCGTLRLLRALGGTRILQAAAPTAPPCFGRWPRSSPLHRGCFCAVFSDVAAAVRIHPRLWPQRGHIRKTPVYFYTSVFLVERSNPNPNHCPLGHLWRQFHRK